MNKHSADYKLMDILLHVSPAADDLGKFVPTSDVIQNFIDI